MKIAAETLALAIMANVTNPIQALAWGDEGHQVVALIAQSFLDSDVRKRVTALLAADTDDLTAHDIASAATWADKYRDANFEGSRAKTRQWHFTDIEIAAPDLPKACFNHCIASKYRCLEWPGCGLCGGQDRAIRRRACRHKD